MTTPDPPADLFNPLALADLTTLTGPNQCVCNNLRMTSRAVTRFYQELVGPDALRATQMSLLLMASRLPHPTINQIAERLSMDRTTLTRNLWPLEGEELVRVKPGADRREKLVRLTDKGRAALRVTMERWRTAQRRLVEGLGPERAERLLADLAEVRRIAEGK